MNRFIIGILLLLSVMAGCGAPASDAPTPSPASTSSLASTPAEILSVVKMGMDESTAMSLLDKSKLDIVTIELSGFSIAGGQVEMMPKPEESEVPATHVLRLVFCDSTPPIGIAHSLGDVQKVVFVGEISSEAAQWYVDFKAGKSPAPISTPKGASTAVLRCLSWSNYTEYGYIHVVGEVQNISNKKLENIMAVVSFRTIDGTLVKTEDALIDYDVLMPGQVSPFEVLTSDNPMIKNLGISFKEFWGSMIPTEFEN